VHAELASTSKSAKIALFISICSSRSAYYFRSSYLGKILAAYGVHLEVR
jgi:hypothetical protein